MKRGSFGVPYRGPAGGWPVAIPPYPDLYRDLEPSLDGLTKEVNETVITLQQNQVGRPMTRPALIPPPAGGNCQQPWSNGLPIGPWIGLLDNQGLPYILGGNSVGLGVLRNTFQQQGTNSKGLNCRLRGFKNVQAARNWHGVLGWLSDAYGCPDTNCNTGSGNCSGGSWDDSLSQYLSYHATAGQTKYRTLTSSGSLVWIRDDGTTTAHQNCQVSGAVSIDANSGLKTSTLLTAEQDYDIDDGTGTRTDTANISGGAGYTPTSNGTVTHGLATLIDAFAGADVHCAFPVPPSFGTDIVTYMRNLNESICANTANYSAYTLFPAITDPNNYTGAASFTNLTDTYTNSYTVTWSRTDTVAHFKVVYTTSGGTSPSSGDPLISYTLDVTWTLSNANTSGGVMSDVATLMNYWPLNDDGMYPWRTDGVWPVAPLVTREEANGPQVPTGFNTYTVDDLRSPINDKNGNAPFTTPNTPPPLGWTYSPNNNDVNGLPPSNPSYLGPAAWLPTYAQMSWFDPNAYGFYFPPGYDQSNSAAQGWKQFALTGKVLGMPMPRAFTDANSYWYDPTVTVPGGGVDFQNFFDYRAQIWKCCEWGGGSNPYRDFYLWGHGEWLYDAITRTAAQLPHCATQWTDNIHAMSLPPYAFIIEGDQQTYDQNGPPGPSSDFHSSWTGVVAQKCCEIQEIWPEEDYFRPAGADKFTFDESQTVYCLTGTALTNNDGTPAASLTKTGVWGGASAGGFYNGFTTDGSGTITLGPKVSNVPSDWTQPVDAATAFGELRWYAVAPSILGRAAVTSVTDLGGSRKLTLASALTTLGLTVAADDVDIYDASMTLLASNVAVTRVDDTHFDVPTALATIATAAWITSHGAPHWYWDDNQRKGDFTAFQWLYDYRTNGEFTRLAGVTDCGGHTPPSGGPSLNNGYAATSALVAACTAGNSLTWASGNYQAQGGMVYRPCNPGVIAFTPNGEAWGNAVVIPFPATFYFDDVYGARWQGEIEQAMVDLYWQTPHRPCGLDPTLDTWNMDDGNCHANAANLAGGTDYWFAHYPLVESRISLPSNGGNAQNENAPSLPSGITLGYNNPVTYPALTNVLYPPGTVGFTPNTGNPASTYPPWQYRLTIENSSCAPASCRFPYADVENLACLQLVFVQDNVPPPAPLGGLPGLT
ncbi:MAG: hypothetical protein KGL39_02920 [Patescibacteria group bacterium]|nr:hypothetical protein [Patescibacteria group bacterium]